MALRHDQKGREQLDERARNLSVVETGRNGTILSCSGPRKKRCLMSGNGRTVSRVDRCSRDRAPGRSGAPQPLVFKSEPVPQAVFHDHSLWRFFHLQSRRASDRPSPQRECRRFGIEGEGAFTTVEGEKCTMSRGDLVITPSGTWHDHGNDGKQPTVWLDMLDLPLVENLNSTIFEFDYTESDPKSNSGQPVRRQTQTVREPNDHSQISTEQPGSAQPS